jgi:pilus assembly protein FimV
LLLLALALAVALPAFALGLGRIVVKSAPGQPLLAEIPVVAADPSELGNLQVRLASPETFRRVGLPAPDAATANLRFTVAVDGRGQPVIRVTSAAPLRQPLLTFLIEVDWGAGRLVREYSALLEAPSSMAAPAQPIQAPTVATPNTIVRTPEPAPAAIAAPPPATAPAAPAPAALPAAPAEAAARPAEPPATAGAGNDAEVVAEPLPEPVPAPPPSPSPEPMAAAPVPAPAMPQPEAPQPEASAPTAEAARPSTGAAAASAVAASAHTVLAGETLGAIAGGLDRGARSLDQMMLALLQTNPEAFIDGNINLIREGAVLRAPSDEALARYSNGEAAALVRQQVAQWRQAAAARMPAAAATIEGSAPAQAPAARADGAGRNTSGAHLQIVPPASGKGAGTQSGAQAGGEGTMLRQEIQETRETVAARDAEVGELKTRVAELQNIQQQQQQLIAMKDSALAEARANLAKAQQQALQAPPPAKADSAGRDLVLWPWLVLALLVAAAGGWWWKRGGGAGRARPFPVPRKPAPVAPAVRGEPAPAPAVPSFAAPASAPSPVASSGPVAPATSTPAPVPPPVAPPPVAPPPIVTPPPAAAPTPASAPSPAHWTAAPDLVGTMPPASPAPVRPDENASPARKVELARAYLDLGDESAARELLREAMEGRDPVAREIAARMLREID